MIKKFNVFANYVTKQKFKEKKTTLGNETIDCFQYVKHLGDHIDQCLTYGGRDISSPAIWATKISAHFGDNNVAQISRQICSHIPSALNSGAKRSDVPYGHASMLLLGEGSEATEPYNKYANLFKYIS